jgi:hypothetical protein
LRNAGKRLGFSAVLRQHATLELLRVGHARRRHDAHAACELLAVESLPLELSLRKQGVKHARILRQVCH